MFLQFTLFLLQTMIQHLEKKGEHYIHRIRRYLIIQHSKNWLENLFYYTFYLFELFIVYISKF